MAAVPLVANQKTVKEDAQLFFAVSQQYSVPTASRTYLTPRAFSESVRQHLPQRNRYNHDHHDTCMYIARSKNANVVAYTANLVDVNTRESVESGIRRHCVLRRDDPIHPYFVNLEPSYVAERRRKGIEYDCDDLNMLERTMAYGVSANPINTEGVLQYWGKRTPEAFAELLRDWAAGGSTKGEGEEGSPSDGATDGNGGSSGSGGLDGVTADTLDAALASWWAPFSPYVSHFVALPTWPGLVLCLPPLSTMAKGDNDNSDEPSSSSSRSGATPDSATAPPPPQEKREEEEEERTCTTYGTHTEPSPVTPATGKLSEDDTVVVIVALIAGELSIVNSVYVSSVEPKRFYQLPRVEYIEVHGTSLATGKPTYEKKVS